MLNPFFAAARLKSSTSTFKVEIFTGKIKGKIN